jgi:hypothetical protein
VPGGRAGCKTPGTHLVVELSGWMSACLRPRERYQDWGRVPFTGESQDHISVSEVNAAPAG